MIELVLSFTLINICAKIKNMKFTGFLFFYRLLLKEKKRLSILDSTTIFSVSRSQTPHFPIGSHQYPKILRLKRALNRVWNMTFAERIWSYIVIGHNHL